MSKNCNQAEQELQKKTEECDAVKKKLEETWVHARQLKMERNALRASPWQAENTQPAPVASPSEEGREHTAIDWYIDKNLTLTLIIDFNL